MTPNTSDTTIGEREKLAQDCERYAKIIEGIIVVADDYRPGDPERREPRETLLKAAAALRASPSIGGEREKQMELIVREVSNWIGNGIIAHCGVAQAFKAFLEGEKTRAALSLPQAESGE